ncbi:hypothetical protein SDC9_203750 [bioreactor metagenome]|uniref:Uncharacterized protein n=1 Tax=bioreactor metagenome TaxID=1076179 RepID=A0A645J6G5_9ZZZZ
MPNAEALLLIHNKQAQILEFYGSSQELMGAYDLVHFACFKPF